MVRAAVVILVMTLACGLVAAQDAVRRDTVEPDAEEREASEAGAAEATRRVEVRERVRRAIALPRATDAARREGVPEETVEEVLRTGRERGVPASDMQEILEAETEAVRAGGDRGNFGAAVLAMKAEGLRGRELAEAIHAEQIARGMKKPKHGAGPPGRGAGGKPGGRAKDRTVEGDDDHGDPVGDDDRGGKPRTKGKGKRGGGA